MAELNEIMSDKKAGTYKKDFFNPGRGRFLAAAAVFAGAKYQRG